MSTNADAICMLLANGPRTAHQYNTRRGLPDIPVYRVNAEGRIQPCIGALVRHLKIAAGGIERLGC